MAGLCHAQFVLQQLSEPHSISSQKACLYKAAELSSTSVYLTQTWWESLWIVNAYLKLKWTFNVFKQQQDAG